MKIDFNNVRVQAARTLNRLIEKLEELEPDERDYLEKDVNELATQLGFICHSYEPNSEDFKDVGAEALIKPFNHKEEE